MSGTTSRGTARGLLVGRRGTGDRAGRPYAGHWYLYGPYLPLEPRARNPAPEPAAAALHEEVGELRAALARAGRGGTGT